MDALIKPHRPTVPHDTTIVLSTSGGKDSTATMLLLMEWEIPFIPVFADTGNEHEATLEYLYSLPDKIGCPPIITVKADFTNRIAAKRKFIANDKRDPNLPGRLGGWSDEAKEKALEVLYPSGNPFLDLCLWKGRFPSRKAQFCSEELKANTAYEEVIEPILISGKQVWSVRGIRKDESLARANTQQFETDTRYAEEITQFHPIADWTAAEVFKMHKRHGLEPNPLYRLGMGRVGCMPCINASKQELYEISVRFPEHIEKVKEWERIVSLACKRQESTFFAAKTTPFKKVAHIADVVSWSKTAHGGRKFDLLKTLEPPACSSIYGLCE